MLCTACPQCGGNLSSIQLPLPSPPPPEFACLPEHFVEDIADVLLYVSRYAPQLLAAARMDELMLFLVVFMGRCVPPPPSLPPSPSSWAGAYGGALT